MAEATWTGPEKKCATGSTRPLQCGGESCGDRCGLEKCPRSSVQITVPDEFKNGAVPKVVLANIAPGAVGSASGEPTESDTNTAVTTPVTDAETAGEKLAPEEKKDSTEDTAQERSLTTKKNSQGDGPLKSVRVFLNNKMVRELSDGEVATIALNGKTVAFEGWTGGKQAGTMRFKVNGVIDKKIERVPPYAFKGNKGRDLNGWPASEVILNKPFTFEIELENGSNRYSKKVTMTLTN